MARTAEIQDYQSPLELGTLHADVIAECSEARTNNSPWTRIRELRKGVDVTEGLTCDGATGDRADDCSGKVEGVQYSSVQGESQHYCEKHALAQNEWDIVHYYSKPKPVPPLTKEQEAFVAKLLVKKVKMKQKEEIEETDLMK